MVKRLKDENIVGEVNERDSTDYSTYVVELIRWLVFRVAEL